MVATETSVAALVTTPIRVVIGAIGSPHGGEFHRQGFASSLVGLVATVFADARDGLRRVPQQHEAPWHFLPQRHSRA